MQIATQRSLRVYRDSAKEMLPQTEQSTEDERAWEHLIDQADTLPMENRPADTRHNATIDDFESEWLAEHGQDVALYPREQQLAGFLRQMTQAARQLPIHQASTDTSFPPDPQWTRVSEMPLEKFRKEHYQMAKRLAETSPIGQGVGSEKVYLQDILRLKDKLTASDSRTLTEMQATYFPWKIDDSTISSRDEIYSNESTGVRVEMPYSKSVHFENVEPLHGIAHGTRLVVVGGLEFHVPEGSKVLLQGTAEFYNEHPTTLSAVERADSGKAEFRSWFRYGGSIYRTSKKYPYNRSSGSLQNTVRFMVTAPPEPGSTQPRVLDSGVLQLPPVSRREEFQASASRG